MRPPTTPEIRAVIVRLREEGRTYDEIADLAGVGYATVNRILRLHRETGGTSPAKPGGGNLSPIRGKVEHRLRSLVEKMPDATVREFAEALQRAEELATSRPSVQRALTRMGYSRKKRRLSR
jgi:transposase